MDSSRNILMVASENDALPGGKVGGIGDVVRDAPPALAERGCTVTVIIPAYGFLAAQPGARRITALEVGFAGTSHRVELYEVPARQPRPEVRHIVADHPLFSACGAGRIYCDDPPGAPFATDATKFALFCAAVAEAVTQGVFGHLDVLHLHDWHAAFLLILRRFHPAFRSLHDIRSVYTIHNLALQGVRPFTGHPSSLNSWYPGLVYNRDLLADPRWLDTVNPMAIGIRLADAVHVVSPTYAEEILHSSAVTSRGYYGGEGLEEDLQMARDQGRLIGILNGCEYPATTGPVPAWSELPSLLRAQVLRWAGAQIALSPTHFIAHARLQDSTPQRPGTILTSVSRITDQKVRLLRQSDDQGRPALEGILEVLGDRGIYLFLGSGDPDFERFLTATSANYANFIFLRGYSETAAQALYAAGDLFLMPSSFEPCGISQMLAMRAGQPCLVHHVGGLKDTVQDGVNGFAFTGGSLAEQATQLVETFKRTLELHQTQPERWAEIHQAAAAARFSWQDSVAAYIEKLYSER